MGFLISNLPILRLSILPTKPPILPPNPTPKLAITNRSGKGKAAPFSDSKEIGCPAPVSIIIFKGSFERLLASNKTVTYGLFCSILMGTR